MRPPETQMGAGIAADPLSPDFDPLGISEEIPAPSGFGGPLHLGRGRHQASRFGHRGQLRYPCGPQQLNLGGQLGSRANPFPSLWPLLVGPPSAR
jgi:hypothetical protein